MREFYCHCESAKCPLPAPTQAFSCFKKSFIIVQSICKLTPQNARKCFMALGALLGAENNISKVAINCSIRKGLDMMQYKMAAI